MPEQEQEQVTGGAGQGGQPTARRGVPTDLQVDETGDGPGGEYASTRAIGWTLGFQIVLLALVTYFLVGVWPEPTPAMSYAERDRVVAARDTSGRPLPGATQDTGQAAQAQADSPAAQEATKGPQTAPGGTASGGGGQAGAGSHAAGAGERHARLVIPGPGVVGVPGFYQCKQPDSTAVWVVHEDDILDPQCVRIRLLGTFPISNEERLVLIVLLCGALGALLHGLRSLRWYVGTRHLKQSWLLQYYVFPFLGALLAFGIYTVLRGGFFNPATDVSDTNPLSFAAAAFLVGLFNEEAIEKLREIARAFFTPKPPGPEKAPEGKPATGTTGTAVNGDAHDDEGPEEEGDAAGDDEAPPPGAFSVMDVALAKDAQGADLLEITGTGFTSATEVEVDRVRRQPQLVDDTRLTLPLAPDEVAKLAGLATLEVVVVTPGPQGGRSNPFTVPSHG